MTRDAALDRGLEAFRRGEWREAYAQFVAAQQTAPLEPADLERLAKTAYLLGNDGESEDLLSRAHQAFLGQDDPMGAARCAVWLTFTLFARGDRARSAGWAARAERLLDSVSHDSVERGYLLIPTALRAVGEGDFERSDATFAAAVDIGERFGDRDLVSLARQGRGRALIRLGQTKKGVALLDEVMVAVTSGELSPIIAGIIYCSVIEACFEMFDLGRAQEWTDALGHWCASQPDMVPYRGECQVRRAEIMLLHGEWPDAADEAARACAPSAESSHPASGSAFYQLAEAHRLRGEFAKAEDAYRLASEAGRTPHPGLSLLWLAQGRADAAKAAICRVVDEARDRRTRSRVLAAFVEILLASGDVASARRGAEELGAIAAALGTTYIKAVSAHVTGAVRLAEGDARRALSLLREACALWRELEAPYEAARVSVLVGLACRELGDADTGDLEIDAACRAFGQLGATPDADRARKLLGATPPGRDGGLTTREVQVLRLVARGKTNREIAKDLAISEKTVARHMSNIFTKLDLPSRAAATAYAFQHDLM